MGKPTSARSKKERARARTRARAAHGKDPLAITDERITAELSEMDATAIPFVGLALWYLFASPVRVPNQCLLASVVLRDALRDFGIEAHLVNLELSTDWAEHGRGSRRGQRVPRFEGGQLEGHVGLIADSWFVDATASQFAEVFSNGGVRPLVGSLGDQASVVLAKGALLEVNLTNGRKVGYAVHPAGSADEVAAEFVVAQQGDVIRRMVEDLKVGFLVALALVRPDLDSGFPLLDEQVRAHVGMTAERVSPDASLTAVPRV